MKRLCMILLALGTVPAFAQEPPTTTQQWITTVPWHKTIHAPFGEYQAVMPYHAPDWGPDLFDCVSFVNGSAYGAASSDVTGQWHFIPCPATYETVYESVNDPIPAVAVAPQYWQNEPFCPTTEYRIRWFVVEDPLSGKTFSARCVPSK